MAIQWEHVTKWDPDPLLDTYDSLIGQSYAR